MSEAAEQILKRMRAAQVNLDVRRYRGPGGWVQTEAGERAIISLRGTAEDVRALMGLVCWARPAPASPTAPSENTGP